MAIGTSKGGTYAEEHRFAHRRRTPRALAQEEAGEPPPVGREAAQRLIGEMFDRSEGRPEPAGEPA